MSCSMHLRMRMYLDSWICLVCRVYYVLTEPSIVPIVEIVPGWKVAATEPDSDSLDKV